MSINLALLKIVDELNSSVAKILDANKEPNDPRAMMIDLATAKAIQQVSKAIQAAVRESF